MYSVDAYNKGIDAADVRRTGIAVINAVINEIDENAYVAVGGRLVRKANVAVLWECGERQTDRQTYRHTDGRDQYTLCLKKDTT